MRCRKIQPCCRTSFTAILSDWASMSELSPDRRDLRAVQDQCNSAGYEHHDGKREKKALVPLHLNAEESQMAHDRSTRGRYRQNCPCPNKTRCQQQYSCDQLHDS